MTWLLIILSLPTENATARMRTWRALKAAGAASLRDGVYLLPDLADHYDKLSGLADEVLQAGGDAHVLRTSDSESGSFSTLFDRSQDYDALIFDVANLQSQLTPQTVMRTIKEARKLRSRYARIAQIDFFPGTPQEHTDNALRALETAINQTFSANEPTTASEDPVNLGPSAYQGRTWATRQRPWVDRLASAWLIGRFIDRSARFLWLPSPDDCPADALGFDFDGATFTHVANKVTFETLLDSFGLDQHALRRLGTLVHYLDVGGDQPPEAAGIESILMGLREIHQNDDDLLAATNQVFDSLFQTYAKEP